MVVGNKSYNPSGADVTASLMTDEHRRRRRQLESLDCMLERGRRCPVSSGFVKVSPTYSDTRSNGSIFGPE